MHMLYAHKHVVLHVCNIAYTFILSCSNIVECDALKTVIETNISVLLH